MVTVALVLSILSIIASVFLSWLGFAWIGVVLGIIGLTLSIIEIRKKNPETKNRAVGAMLCSIVGMVVGLALWIAFAFFALAANFLAESLAG